MYWDDEPSRRNFTITTKKIEWISAARKDVMQYIRDKKFVRTSRCRKCKSNWFGETVLTISTTKTIIQHTTAKRTAISFVEIAMAKQRRLANGNQRYIRRDCWLQNNKEESQL